MVGVEGRMKVYVAYVVEGEYSDKYFKEARVYLNKESAEKWVNHINSVAEAYGNEDITREEMILHFESLGINYDEYYDDLSIAGLLEADFYE
jgi:hypothetical protein